MELQGTVKKIFETQTFASGFQKREMILLTQEQYPQPISIEFLSEKTNLLDSLKEGDNIKAVSYTHLDVYKRQFFESRKPSGL